MNIPIKFQALTSKTVGGDFQGKTIKVRSTQECNYIMYFRDFYRFIVNSHMY